MIKIIPKTFILLLALLQILCVQGAAHKEYNPLQIAYMIEQKPFNKDAILAIERTIGYTFNKKARLEKAFTTNQQNPHKNYEKYENLGDAVLKLAQAIHIEKEFPKATPDERTKAKGAIESMAPLCALGVRLGLHNWIQHNNPEITANIVEDVMEASIWAIYKDGGHDPAERFINRFFYPMIKGHKDIPALPGIMIRLAYPNEKQHLRSKAVGNDLAYDIIVGGPDKPDYINLGKNNKNQAKKKKQTKKTYPKEFTAKYNAELQYVQEQLPEEYHKYLITWPLDADYKEFNGAFDLTLDWKGCEQNEVVRLHTLFAKMGLGKPQYDDKQLDDGSWISSLVLADRVFMDNIPAKTKGDAQNNVARLGITHFQKKILLHESLQKISLQDCLTVMYDDKDLSLLNTFFGNDASLLKPKLYELFQHVHIALPEIVVRRGAGLVSEPAQYYALVKADWLEDSIQSDLFQNVTLAENHALAKLTRQFLNKIRFTEKSQLKSKDLMIFDYIKSGLRDDSKSKKQLLLELIAKMKYECKPEIKTFYADSSLAQPLFFSQVSLDDMVVTGKTRDSKKAAEDQAVEELLNEWMRHIRAPIEQSF